MQKCLFIMTISQLGRKSSFLITFSISLKVYPCPHFNTTTREGKLS